MEQDRISPEFKAERIIERAFQVKDRLMRTAVIGEILRDLPVEEIAQILQVILDRADQKSPKYEEVFLSLTENEFLIGAITPEKFQEMVQYLEKSGAVYLLQLFSSPDRKREVGISGNMEVPTGLEYLTLGEKKALARGKRTLIWEKLLFDLDATVIQNVLLNPRITEKEVIRIASRRPCPGAVLRAIFQNRKWIQRYRVKRALVFNPNTPVEVSLSLLNSLVLGDIQEVARDANLNPDLRERARHILEKRIREKG